LAADLHDGLVEAENLGQEEYGEPRMLGVLQAGASGTPAELLPRMMVDLDLFVGATPQHDDVTCMVVKAS
jgi:serine phosphatase RsbU (regulator of sigma subunit)